MPWPVITYRPVQLNHRQDHFCITNRRATVAQWKMSTALASTWPHFDSKSVMHSHIKTTEMKSTHPHTTHHTQIELISVILYERKPILTSTRPAAHYIRLAKIIFVFSNNNCRSLARPQGPIVIIIVRTSPSIAGPQWYDFGWMNIIRRLLCVVPTISSNDSPE